jgi:hypothetical protein
MPPKAKQPTATQAINTRSLRNRANIQKPLKFRSNTTTTATRQTKSKKATTSKKKLSKKDSRPIIPRTGKGPASTYASRYTIRKLRAVQFRANYTPFGTITPIRFTHNNKYVVKKRLQHATNSILNGAANARAVLTLTAAEIEMDLLIDCVACDVTLLNNTGHRLCIRDM